MKTTRLVVAGALVLIAVLSFWAPAVSRAQAADPEMLLRLHYQASNRADMAAVLATFTEDAVIVRGGCLAQNPCRGIEAVRTQFVAAFNNRVSEGVISSRVSGDTVTARVEFWNINILAAGVQRAIYNVRVTFRGDKISNWIQEPDLTDPQTVVFDNFQRVNLLSGSFSQAVTRRDLPAAVRALSDDVVLEGWAPCLSAPCVGKEAAQQALEQWMADEFQWTVLAGTTQVSGNRLTATLQLRSQSIRAASAEPLRATTTRSVSAAGDRLTEIRFALDAADPRTAAFLGQVADTPRVPGLVPVQMPRAGTGGLQSEGSITAPDPDARSFE